MSDPKRYLVNFPWIVFLAAVMLTGIGLLGIHSATLTTGPDGRTHTGAAVTTQCAWLLVGLVAMCLVLWPSYLRLGRWSYAIYALSIVPLVVLLAARHLGGIPYLVQARHGAYSWFTIPGTRNTLQPSELTKIAFIMVLARYLTYRKSHRRPRGLVLPFLMALLPTALVIRQPDLGTALMFIPVLLLMLIAAGARLRHLLAVIGVALLLAPIFYLKIDAYQQRRIDTWLLAGPVEEFHMQRTAAERDDRHLSDAEKQAMIDRFHGSPRVQLYLAVDAAKGWAGRHLPWLFSPPRTRSRLAALGDRPDDPVGQQFLWRHWFVEELLSGPAYQSRQAKVAVASGGLTGAGLGRGSQTRNRLLAEARNDFIFAVIAEEWGFVGVLIVIVLYVVIIIFGVDVGLSTNEPFGKLLAVGVVALIAAQAFLNMAITVGLMPVTGIPLPLMSYGGSSLVSAYIAVGLLCNVGLRRYVLDLPQPFEFKD